MATLSQWLDGHGLAALHDVLAENDLDLDILPALSDGDLKEIGLSLGQRRRLLRALQSGDGGKSSSAAERRLLTVLFCDLVGSTEMSARLDPEDLRDVMRRYQDVVSGAVSRYGGHVAKFLGDGVLAYFGWPQAYEDQAERAVRAGLDAIAAVQGVRLEDNRALDARVGIATGEVVVGDLVGEAGMDAEAVSGETPNLAARLQQLAVPGQVVIGATTHDLLRQTFDLTDLGGHELKGFAGDTQAWGVAGEGAAESRFEAARGAIATPMVGRDDELAQLSDCWRLACAGNGQFVIISGEAGIGKSRLTEAISIHLAGQSHFRVGFQCSPYHTTSPLYPAVQQLQRAAGIAPSDGDETKLDKLERLLEKSHAGVTDVWALFANLLSLPYQPRYGELDMSPLQIKQATLEALFGELRLLAETRPVLFVFEDAHWIDPTTLELLSMAVTGIRQSRILFLVTHRPEWQLPGHDHENATKMLLNRLGREDNAIIARAIGGDRISADAVESIVSRTDGVPLFVEELTKTLVESGFELSESDIPATLQASLLARLDRLGQEAKEIAQIGAVIGREFPYDLLAEVAGRNKRELDAALDALVRSELMFRQGTPGKIHFTFKHALVQDAAYGSLLRSRRQEFHAEIARTLETRFAAQVENQPELLARHFTNAGLIDDAIAYWRRAAALAVARSANQEALKHFDQALDLLPRLPESEERDRLELDMRVAQGVPAIAATGYSSPEVEAVYLRARDLSAKLGDKQRMFPVLRGLWNLYVDRAEFETALRYANMLIDQAEAEKDFERIALACRALGFTRLQMAEYAEAGDALTRSIDAMHRHGKSADLQQYGEDGGAAARQYLTWVQTFDGLLDQAVTNADDTIRAADAMDHALSRAFARGIAAFVFNWRGEPDTLMRLTGEMLEITESHGLVFWLAASFRHRGWALGVLGRLEEGIEMMEESERMWQQTGAEILKPTHFALLSELYGLDGDLDAGLRAVREGLDAADNSGERWYQPELMRLEGWLLRLAGQSDQARHCYVEAVDTARSQKNLLWLLRSATSLAELRADEGDGEGARALLAPIYDRFTEGFDTRYLVDAKKLLTRLDAAS